MTTKALLYIGTYTEPIKFGTGKILDAKGEGIYLFELDRQTGELYHKNTMTGIRNPSYLAVSPDKKYLYSVNELKEHGGKKGGQISSFSINNSNYELSLINQQPSHGEDPCFITTDKSGNYVFVANFMSGSVAVYPVDGEGVLKESTDFIQHHGSSINIARQSGPHAHSVSYIFENDLVLVPDLGIDKVLVYKFDSTIGKLLPREELSVETEAGSGPRHLAVHPSCKFAYLVNELDSTILALSYNTLTGKMSAFQKESLLPEDFTGESTSSDIRLTPSGDFLYSTNRGHNSIVGYKVNLSTGILSYVGHTPAKGKTPRNFAIDTERKLLIAANQDSNTIVTFWIDAKTGHLGPTGYSAEVPTPVCVKVL
jgi:6-phosphogluconolactonase